MMNLDREKLQKILHIFAQEDLLSPPSWVGLIRHTGELVCHIGELKDFVTPINDSIIAQQVKLMVEQNYSSLEVLKHGNFQTSIHIGGYGALVIGNLNDQFFLAVSYHHDQFFINSLDALQDAFAVGASRIMDAIWLGNFEPSPQQTPKIQTLPPSPERYLDDGVVAFMKGLPDKPAWGMVINEKGDLVGFAGKMHYGSTLDDQPIDPVFFAKSMQKHIQTLYEDIAELKLKPFTDLVMRTGKGVIFLVPLPFFVDDYFLIFSYTELSKPFETIFENGIRLQLHKLIDPIMKHRQK